MKVNCLEATSHTPDKEVDGVLSAMIASSFPSIGVNELNPGVSTTPGQPARLFKSPEVYPSRRTPGAFDSSHNLTGAFEQHHKMSKISVNKESPANYFNSWSPAAGTAGVGTRSRYPLQPLHPQMIHQNQNNSYPQMQIDVHSPDLSLSDHYNKKKSPRGESPRNHSQHITTLSFEKGMNEDHENDEEPSPASQMMRKYVQDLTASPSVQLDETSATESSDSTADSSDKQRLFELEMLAAAKETLATSFSPGPLSQAQIQARHFTVSPGKNIHSAVFEPMSRQQPPPQQQPFIPPPTHQQQQQQQQHQHQQQQQFPSNEVMPHTSGFNRSNEAISQSQSDDQHGMFQGNHGIFQYQHKYQHPPQSQPPPQPQPPSSNTAHNYAMPNQHLHDDASYNLSGGYRQQHPQGFQPHMPGTAPNQRQSHQQSMHLHPSQQGQHMYHHHHHQDSQQQQLQQQHHQRYQQYPPPVHHSDYSPHSRQPNAVEAPPPLYSHVNTELSRSAEARQELERNPANLGSGAGSSSLQNQLQFQHSEGGTSLWSSFSSLGSDNSTTVESTHSAPPDHRGSPPPPPPPPPPGTGHTSMGVPVMQGLPGAGNSHPGSHQLTNSHYSSLAPSMTPSHGGQMFPPQATHMVSSHPGEYGLTAGTAVNMGNKGSGVAPQRRSKEDPTKATRQDQHMESASGKAAYKAFAKVFTQKEAVSVDDALAYASEAVKKAPVDIKWHIYVDAADLMRRHNRFDEARYLYSVVSSEFPQAHQGWIEWSKLEEEDGKFDYSLSLLRKGTKASRTYNEVLLLRAIKQHEKLNSLDGSRVLLGKLCDEPIEKIWRTVLEGALLEERAGNVSVARKLLCVLVHKVAWYGPIYYEAFRLEEKAELFNEAYLVIRKGLAELPRYGPLWFGLLRIMERTDIGLELNAWQRGDGTPPTLFNVRRECQSAIYNISRELVWKVHFEQAQIEERAATVVAHNQASATSIPFEVCLDGLLASARKCFVLSMLACPSNLRWKIFLAGARMELNAGKFDTVKALLRQAHLEVPEKSRYHVFLECCRLEELTGSVDEARKILAIARFTIKNEWKIYLESVLVEARAGDMVTAIFMADEALRMDSGSGRLWALLLQLIHRVEWKQNMIKTLESESMTQHGLLQNTSNISTNKAIRAPQKYIIPSKISVLYRALQVVPKSGEVWCEGARVVLNPLSADLFDPCQALKFLSFAIMFTPQYGDSFIEYVRLEMLMQVILPRVLALLGIPSDAFFSLLETFDDESDFVDFMTSPQREKLKPCAPHERTVNMILAAEGKLSVQTSCWSYNGVSLRHLYRRCLNADPNYGTSWFYYRQRPIDTPGTIIDHVKGVITHELSLVEPVYVHAMARYIGRVVALRPVIAKDFDFASWLGDWQAACPEMATCTAPLRSVDGLVTMSPQDFITGTMQLSRVLCTTGRSAPVVDRKEMLYGSDQITP